MLSRTVFSHARTRGHYFVNYMAGIDSKRVIDDLVGRPEPLAPSW